MPLFGIDCSSFQGNWDAAAEHTNGLAFGIEKATQGVRYTNPDYAPMVTEMPAAGLVPGAYHYTDGTGSGAAQADHFVNVVGDGPGVLLAQDVEALGQIGRAEVVDWFVEVNRLVPRRDMLCYTGQDFWNQITGHLDHRVIEDRIGQRIVLWDAGDGHRPNIYVPARGSVAQEYASVSLAGWNPYGGWSPGDRLFLQFTDHATEPGVSGGVDGDAFFGSVAQLQALAAVTTPPAPTMEALMSSFVQASAPSKDGAVKKFMVFETAPGARHWINDPAVWDALAAVGHKAAQLTGDQIAAQWPAIEPVDPTVLAAAISGKLHPTLDVAAVVAQLGPILKPGATIEEIKALLATLKVTAG